MDSVCRTCLCIIRNGCVLNPIHQLKPDGETSDRHKLEACVPELSVDIVLEPVICKSCKESLALAFHFKTVCMETERALYNYIQQRRQNENCTNLLNTYDLLALVRNDIIQEHSYSTVARQANGEFAQASSVLQREDFDEVDVVSKTLDEPRPATEAVDTDDDKRILRPRRSRYQNKSDVNGNKVAKTSSTRKKCLKRSPSKNSLQTKEKPFPCVTCKKSFVQRAQLIIHTRTHIEEKPFACTICKVSFKRKAHLSGHVRIHTKDKLFCCDKCPKRFLKSNALHMHLRCHKKKKNKCKTCNNLFEDFFSYKSHLGKCAFLHTHIENDLDEINGENLSCERRRRSQRLKYICEVCRRGFATSFSRNKHAQHQHVDH